MHVILAIPPKFWTTKIWNYTVLPSEVKSSTWDLIKIVWLQCLLFVCLLKDHSCSPQWSITDSKGYQTWSPSRRTTIDATPLVCWVRSPTSWKYVLTLKLAFLRKSQPQLSEPSIIRTLEPAKVQLKVNILGMISICACAVECSAAIVCYIRTNRLGALK